MPIKTYFSQKHTIFMHLSAYVIGAILPLGLLGKAGSVIPIMIACLFMIIIGLYKGYVKDFFYDHKKICCALFLIIVFLAIHSLIISDAPLHSLLIWLRTSLLVVCFIVIWQVSQQDSCFLPNIKQSFLWISIVIVPCYVFYFIYIKLFHSHYFALSIMHNKTSASLSVFMMLFYIYYWYTHSSKNLKIHLLYGFLCCGMLIIQSSLFFMPAISKASLVGYACSIISILIFYALSKTAYKNHAKYIIILCFMGLAMGCFYYVSHLYSLNLENLWQKSCSLYASNHEQFTCLLQAIKKTHAIIWLDTHRTLIWSHVLEYIAHYSFLGVGLDRSNHMASPILPEYVFYLPAHPHNWLLELILDAGFMGALLVCIPLSMVLYRLGIKVIESFHPTSVLLWAGLLYYTISSLANYSLWSYWWMGSAVVALAIMASYESSYKRL